MRSLLWIKVDRGKLYRFTQNERVRFVYAGKNVSRGLKTLLPGCTFVAFSLFQRWTLPSSECSCTPRLARRYYVPLSIYLAVFAKRFRKPAKARNGTNRVFRFYFPRGQSETAGWNQLPRMKRIQFNRSPPWMLTLCRRERINWPLKATWIIVRHLSARWTNLVVFVLHFVLKETIKHRKSTF